jgi:hypothetical protein
MNSTRLAPGLDANRIAVCVAHCDEVTMLIDSVFDAFGIHPGALPPAHMKDDIYV